MYAPAEDTLLLAECVLQYNGKWALEIGVGSGAVTDALARNFDCVAGSDIDLESLKYCRARNGRVMLACCDAASAFRGRFDMIAINPPYLPDDKKKDRTVHGGLVGTEATVHFIKSSLPLMSPNGRMLVVASSLADQSLIDSLAKEMKLKKKIIKEKALFYERLYVIELTF